MRMPMSQWLRLPPPPTPLLPSLASLPPPPPLSPPRLIPPPSPTLHTPSPPLASLPFPSSSPSPPSPSFPYPSPPCRSLLSPRLPLLPFTLTPLATPVAAFTGGGPVAVVRRQPSTASTAVPFYMYCQCMHACVRLCIK